MKQKLESKKDIARAFDLYSKEIYRFIWIRFTRNREEAEDIVQEVFIKAWDKRKSYKSENGTIKNWLFTIARNHVVDSYRKDRLSSKTYSNHEYIDNISDSYTELSNEYLSLLDCMDKLSEEEKDMIYLRYINELSIGEVAKIIQKQYSATKVYLFRTLKKLRKLYETYE